MAAHAVAPLRLKKNCDDAVRKGVPWIYASDIIESSELVLAPAGSLVSIENHKGQAIATGYYNARSQIACRVLTHEREPIDAAFFRCRLEAAAAKRDKLVGVPYYRLVHSEADGLPGLLVDRFGESLVAQAGTAGMEALQPYWVEALELALAPASLLLRNDTAAREREGLAREVKEVKGPVPQRITVLENDCAYVADIWRGQKTGWFYDQRDNRRLIAGLAEGKSVADIYSHSGGFGVLAARHGAASVAMVDSSKLALELAAEAAARNGVEKACAFLQGDAFEAMEQLQREGRHFDIVLADPPAFVKNKKDIASGLKGYVKVARLAAGLVAPGGLLFMASCSHYAGRSAFNQSVLGGVERAGARGTILKQTGASPDHPQHPLLPQSEYLKGILLKIDCA